MALSFWRLEGATTNSIRDANGLAAGLQLHLAHASLSSTLMKIGDQQRAYVALSGCDGCRHGRCEPGCRVELFRRLLRATLRDTTLLPVAQGLAMRPYRRLALAWPGTQAQPIDGHVLTPWDEARLTLFWRRDGQHTIAASALLAAGIGDPHPVRLFADRGWHAVPLPVWMLRWIAHIYVLTMFSRRCPQAPALLLPISHKASADIPPDDEPSSLTTPLAQALDQVLAQARATPQVTEPTPPDTAAPDWPAGPGRMQPADVAAIIERLRSDPAIIAATPPGVTKGRLRGMVDPGLAEPLLVWLDAAGVLAEPERPELRWREPRLLREADRTAIAARLRATPPPDDAAVYAALGGGR